MITDLLDGWVPKTWYGGFFKHFFEGILFILMIFVEIAIVFAACAG
jgi:hypothetical protein